MPRITYEDIAAHLTDDALRLFKEMAAAHLEAGGGDRFFMSAGSMSGTR